MNFQPWQRSGNNSSDNVVDIRSNMSNTEDESANHTSAATSTTPLGLGRSIQTHTPFAYTGRSLGQFNEDVSHAVLALVQVKQPRHEEVHEQVLQKMSKFSRPTIPALSHDNSNYTVQRQQVRPDDQLLQQMDAHRELLLSNNSSRQQQQQHLQLPPPSLHLNHPQGPPQLVQPLQQHSTSFPELLRHPINTKGNSAAIDRNGKMLSNTKRAAQNRNAQKLFRLRREQYVKDLEAQVRESKMLKETISSLREENQQLRDYILTLQGKLLETDNANILIKDNQQP